MVYTRACSTFNYHRKWTKKATKMLHVPLPAASSLDIDFYVYLTCPHYLLLLSCNTRPYVLPGNFLVWLTPCNNNAKALDNTWFSLILGLIIFSLEQFLGKHVKVFILNITQPIQFSVRFNSLAHKLCSLKSRAVEHNWTTISFLYTSTMGYRRITSSAMYQDRTNQTMLDHYCVRIPRKNILKPKPNAGETSYKQTKIISHCKVLMERQNVLRPKKDQTVKSKRQMRLVVKKKWWLLVKSSDWRVSVVLMC